MSDPFVHLHVASGYSLRHGASHPRALVERAADHGMDALALTDRDGMYGADPTLSERLGLRRQWLHAMRLGFRHPGTGEAVEYSSRYPADLQHALDVLAGVTPGA